MLNWFRRRSPEVIVGLDFGQPPSAVVVIDGKASQRLTEFVDAQVKAHREGFEAGRAFERRLQG